MWLTRLVPLSALTLAIFSLGSMPGQATERATAPVEVVETEVTPSTIAYRDVLTIGTTFINHSSRLDGLTVAIDVRSTDGTSVLHEKQSGVGVGAGDEQSVYWVWRIPQRVPEGDYVV